MEFLVPDQWTLISEIGIYNAVQMLFHEIPEREP
jgi:hypothetical protein